MAKTMQFADIQVPTPGFGASKQLPDTVWTLSRTNICHLWSV